MSAYVHYLECRATGTFPDDPLVRRNAAAIRAVEDSVARIRSEQAAYSPLASLAAIMHRR